MDKKNISLTLEFLVKCKSISKQNQLIYEGVLNSLCDSGLSAKSMFDCKQIKTLLQNKISDEESAKKYLSKLFKHYQSDELNKLKKEVFNSLMSGNFPNHKKMLKKGLENFEASLSDVEAKMYMMIKTYISLLCESLDFYMIFDSDKKKDIQEITDFAKNIHELIMKHLFYEEEKPLLEQSLKQLSIVYIGIYYKSYHEN